MGILLNDDELEAMEGLRASLKCLYVFGIRRYMDYKTGIVGIKRGISHQSLSEQLYEEPVKGLNTLKKISKWQTLRAIKALKKAGLISVQSEAKKLILKCNLATWDNSVQNKAAPKPHPKTEIAAPQPAPREDIENYFNSETYKNNNEIPAPQPASSKNEQPQIPAPPPLSGSNIYTYTSLPLDSIGAKTKKSRKKAETPIPDDFCVTEAHREYARKDNLPSPDLEFEKFRNKALEKDRRCADWNAAFRNWLIMAKKFQEEKTSNEKNQRHYSKSTTTKLKPENFASKQYIVPE